MATIITDSELLRRAVTYLDRLVQEKPGKPLMPLLELTAMQFNLGPAAAADLERLFRRERKDQ